MWPATIEGEEEFVVPNCVVDQLLPSAWILLLPLQSDLFHAPAAWVLCF
jgi:hypothetical protein